MNCEGVARISYSSTFLEIIIVPANDEKKFSYTIKKYMAYCIFLSPLNIWWKIVKLYYQKMYGILHIFKSIK